MLNKPFPSSPRRGSTSWHSFWQKKHAGRAPDASSVGHSLEPLSFDPFLEAVRRQMQPEGRAQHTAGMHQYLCTLLPDDVSLADLATGWQVLARGHNDTNSAVKSRRQTCAELAVIAAQVTSEPGELARAVKAWQVWQVRAVMKKRRKKMTLHPQHEFSIRSAKRSAWLM